jgi:hypothetical protein
MLAAYKGTAYDVSYVVAGLAGLLLSIAMLKSTQFSRTTAILGITMGALALVPATAGTVGLVAALLYLVPFVAWLVLVARRLGAMGRTVEARLRVHGARVIA